MNFCVSEPVILVDFHWSISVIMRPSERDKRSIPQIALDLFFKKKNHVEKSVLSENK